jgi:MSHA biogenesis protein MshO
MGKTAAVNKNLCARGFTLIELVMVIMLLGVMSVGISSFIGLSSQIFVNVSERDEIIASARFAVERLNRELRNALPNSVRLYNGFGRECIEFVPIVASSSYYNIPVLPEESSNLLSVVPFLNEDGSNYQCDNCSDIVSVYALNQSEIYDDYGDSSGKLFAIQGMNYIDANQWEMLLEEEVLFTAESPTRRLYIVNDPVAYCIQSQSLRRYQGYNLQKITLPFVPVVPSLMAENLASIDATNPSFKILESSLTRNAIVQVQLHFVRDSEDFVFHNEIHIQNVP